MADKKPAPAKRAGKQKVDDRIKAVMAMAADPNLRAVRNPAMENKIRQGFQSGLFFIAIGASYTATLEDDKAVARALAVTMIPEKWAVIADLVWGD